MFEEPILKDNFGCKIQTGQIALCLFGSSQTPALVAISHTQDKLVVREFPLANRIFCNSRKTNSTGQIDELNLRQVTFVRANDVINSVASKTLGASCSQQDVSTSSTVAVHDNNETDTTKATLPSQTRNLLLIGCASKLLVYDTFTQTNLLTVNVPGTIRAIACEPDGHWPNTADFYWQHRRTAIETDAGQRMIVCGGEQKLYALRFDRCAYLAGGQVSGGQDTTPLVVAVDFLSNNNNNSQQFGLRDNLDVEISSERSTSDTICCIIKGNFEHLDLILTGSRENRICAYSLDSFDYNIQQCRIIIDESAPVNCLCAIKTIKRDTGDEKRRVSQSVANKHSDVCNRTNGCGLPSLREDNTNERATSKATEIEKTNCVSTYARLEMSYFAYGLEDGTVGVYRLFIRHEMAGGNEQRGSSTFGIGAAGGGRLASPAAQSGGQFDNEQQQQWRLDYERVWRHNVNLKQIPLAMVMFDSNGDGLDELQIGYASGRIETRAPFTGQLVFATPKCFGRRSDKLAGLAVASVAWSSFEPDIRTNEADSALQINATNDQQQQQHVRRASNETKNNKDKTNSGPVRALVACSSSGAIVTFKPRQTKTLKPLQAFGVASSSLLATQMQLDRPRRFDDDAEQKLANFPGTSHAGGTQMLAATTIQPGDQQQDETDDADLHIETLGDATQTRRSDAKQNLELLQKIGMLRCEQLKLERKACGIYHAAMQHWLAANNTNSPSVLNVAYRWDLDTVAAKLRLTIVIDLSAGQRVDMIELKDERRNLLPTGHLLLSPANITKSPTQNQPAGNQEQRFSSVIVTLLECSRDEATQLQLRIWCSNIGDEKTVAGNKQQQRQQQHQIGMLSARATVSRMHERLIPVPKFAMFTFVPLQQVQPGKSSSPSRKLFVSNMSNETDNSASNKVAQDHEQFDTNDDDQLIRMRFNLSANKHASGSEVLDWLGENFLCFRFGHLIGDTGSTVPAQSLRLVAELQRKPHSNDHGHQFFKPQQVAQTKPETTHAADEFELQLLDIRKARTASELQTKPQMMNDDDTLVATGNKPNAPVLQGEGSGGITVGRDNRRTFGSILDSASGNTGTKRHQQQYNKQEDSLQPQVGVEKKDLKCEPKTSIGYDYQRISGARLKQRRRQQQLNDHETSCSSSIDFSCCNRKNLLRVAYSNGQLELQCASVDLMVDLVRLLVIDRLRIKVSQSPIVGNETLQQQQTSVALPQGQFGAVNVAPVSCKLDAIIQNSKQLQESERRLQSELYESADHTRNLMQQFVIANQLNEFKIAKGLLSELSMMLSGVQNAAQAHQLNSKTRVEQQKQAEQLRSKLMFLLGQDN